MHGVLKNNSSLIVVMIKLCIQFSKVCPTYRKSYDIIYSRNPFVSP